MEPKHHDMENLQRESDTKPLPLLCTEIKNTGFQFPLWMMQLDEAMPGFFVYKPINRPYVCTFCYPRSVNKYCDHISVVHARHPLVVQDTFLPEDEEYIEDTLRTITDLNMRVIDEFHTEAKYQLMSVMAETGQAFDPPYMKPIPAALRQSILDKENLWDKLMTFYEHTSMYSRNLFNTIQNMKLCNAVVSVLKEATIKINELERVCIDAANQKEVVLKGGVEKEVEKREV